MRNSTRILIAICGGCLAQAALAAPPPAKAPTAKAPAAQAPTAKDLIKDPAEYNAYETAIGLTDPAAKAAALDSFVSTYPKSAVIDHALESMMAAYQEAGNAAGVEATAKKILVLKPDDLRALAVMALLSRNAATQGDAAALAKLPDYAERGLRAARPDGMSNADYAVLRKTADAVFYGARGFALISAKHYAEARESYLRALEDDPNGLSDNYQLGIADMQVDPLDADGFWYLARAANLAKAAKNDTGANSITDFAKRKYAVYHGSGDGWDAIVDKAGVSGAIPTGFAASIARGPTPAEVAVKAVQENDPATLSFSDWEYVLSFRDASPANADAAAKVWATLQAKEKGGAAMIAIPLVVVSATPAAIEAKLAGNDAKEPDFHIVLATPLPALPAVGSTVTATGVITSYQPHPFQFVMEKAHIQP
jgi:tetratricopeptide (TPR) repeat protein